jgi:hypothetical protein
MSLDPGIKKNWIEAQKKSDKPVNAIGVPIDPRDKATLDIWRREGIDQHLHRTETNPVAG